MCKYNLLTRSGLKEMVRLMEVSALLYKWTYCIFTLYGREAQTQADLYPVGCGLTSVIGLPRQWSTASPLTQPLLAYCIP